MSKMLIIVGLPIILAYGKLANRGYVPGQYDSKNV